MKTRNIHAFILGSVIVLGSHQAVLAQAEDVSYAEIGRMEQNAITLLLAAPYRSIWTSWVFPERGKELSYKSVMTKEIDAFGRTRSLQVNDTPGPFKRMEVISIGDKHYRKIDGTPWQLLPPYPYTPDPLGTKPTPGSKPRFENSVKLVETVNDENGMVSVYETVSKSTREENGKVVVSIVTNRFWFRYDGRLLRKDMESETVGEPRILKNSMVYEYDNIKIDEPIIQEIP